MICLQGKAYAEESYPSKLKQADDLFDATVFDQAALLYLEILNESE
jgi:hypothetical protein